MSIRTKLKILSLFTAIGLALVLIVTVLGLQAIRDAEETAHRREQYALNLLEIKASALSTIMLDPTLQETKDVFAAAEKNIDANGKTALAAIRRAALKAELDGILKQWTAYDAESQALIRLAAADAKGANDKLVVLYNQKLRPFQAALEKFVAGRQEDAAQAIGEAQSVLSRTYWAIVLLLAFVAVVDVAIVVTLSRSLSRSLDGIRKQLAPLKDGDLTRRLPADSKDELGEIAAGVNAFVEALQAIVRRTRQRADQLAAAALQLSEASTNVLESSSRQSDATSSVAAAVEEFSVSIDQVAENASQAEQRATQSGEIAQRGSGEVDTAVREIRHIEQAVNEAAQQMDALGRQALEISSIVNVIKDVADQTNLLALNAAIEAARAGETGRGFAVVADEVRKLAERTTASAQEITGMVTAIQKNTEVAAGVMQKGNELVAHGVRQADQAGQSIQQVNEGSSGVLHAISEISTALREQRVAGTEIAQNVERIAQMTEESRSTASEVSAAADGLKRLAAELQEEVAGFSA